MSKQTDYESRTEKLLGPIIEENKFELVDVEYVKEGSGYFLRAYVDKPGGITIDDLEKVSRALSDKLDEEDFIDDAYTLEVSSPGLGRPLKKDKDFERHLGEEVEIKLYKAVGKKDIEQNKSLAPINGEKEFSGILKEYDAKSVLIEITKEETCKVQRSDIALIRLAFDF